VDGCKNYYHLRVSLTEGKVLGTGDLLVAHYSERVVIATLKNIVKCKVRSIIHSLNLINI